MDALQAVKRGTGLPRDAEAVLWALIALRMEEPLTVTPEDRQLVGFMLPKHNPKDGKWSTKIVGRFPADIIYWLQRRAIYEAGLPENRLVALAIIRATKKF